MRPRGESRSSPSSTKVGQVAVQKPQCTHLRRIRSLRAVSGSASCARVKLVCMALTHPPRIEETLGIEAFLHALRQGGERGWLGLEDRHRCPHRLGCADQGGVTTTGIEGAAHEKMVGIGRGWQGEPDEAARPVVKYIRLAALGIDAADNRGPCRRRAGDTPDDRITSCIEGSAIAHLGPKG